MRFAPSALGQLDAACEAFSKVASGFRAQKVLVRAQLAAIWSTKQLTLLLNSGDHAATTREGTCKPECF